MEAQRFPADYDGIVAGAPANNWTRLMAGDFDATLATFKGGVNNLPPSALGLLHRAALSSCDSKDGLPDGVLEDPRRCAFDPVILSCRADEQAETCLTPPQVEAARRVYGGLKDPTTGAQLYPGLAPGSEPFWPNRDLANPFPIPIAHYQWLVFADPSWDWKSFDFGHPADYQAHQKAEAKFAPLLNATDPQPHGVPAPRRQAAPVSRMERPAHCTPQQYQLLRERPIVLRSRSGSGKDASGCPKLLPIVHGARHGALQRRNRPEHLRHAGGAGAMGGARHCT